MKLKSEKNLKDNKMKPRTGSLNRKKLTNFWENWQSTQITNIKNETELNATDSENIKRITREYHEHKFDNLNEINHFLKKFKLPWFRQYEIDKLNSNITIKEIKFIT